MRLHHLALRTSDLPRLERFYVGLLALPVRSRTERSLWLDASGTILMLERAEPSEPLPDPRSLELVCFAIPAQDRRRWEDTLAAAGIPIEGSTQFTMYFRDPDGRRVGLSHHPDAPISPA